MYKRSNSIFITNILTQNILSHNVQGFRLLVKFEYNVKIKKQFFLLIEKHGKVENLIKRFSAD